MKHREASTKVFYGRRFKPCRHRYQCNLVGLCGDFWTVHGHAQFVADIVVKNTVTALTKSATHALKKLLVLCDGRPNKRHCSLRKFYSIGKLAQIVQAPFCKVISEKSGLRDSSNLPKRPFRITASAYRIEYLAET